MDEIRKSDVGVKFLVTLQNPQGTAEDVSAASLIRFHFVKPDRTVLSVTGAFEGTGADGKVQYTTVSGDIDQLGLWRYQVYITLSGGVLHSDVGMFRVTEILV